MKYTATISMSLLVLGVCSARTLDASESPQMDDSSKYAQDYRREGEQSNAEEQKSQPWAQLKDTVYQKLRNMYQQLTSDDYPSALFEDLPKFADPFHVDSVARDSHATTVIIYDNVRFEGLSSAYDAKLNFNVYSHTVTVTLKLKKAEIYGHYKHWDMTNIGTGNFNVKLTGNPTYVYTYRYYLTKGDIVHFMEGDGKLLYGDFDSKYEAFSSFPKNVQKSLQDNLLRMVSGRLYDEVHAKLSSGVNQYIYDHYHKESAEKVMQGGINKAVSGIQQALSKHAVFSIDLTSDNKEIRHNQLRAQIASVKLNGFEKFYLASNQVSNEDSDKIRAKVQLAIDRPTATAVVFIHKVQDENSPFQQITVDFDLEKLMAELSLDKSTRQSALELRSVQTNIDRIRPTGMEKFDGVVSNLITEKMVGHMKWYIEEGLKNFIQDNLSPIMSRGVLPPNQGKRSA